MAVSKKQNIYYYSDTVIEDTANKFIANNCKSVFWQTKTKNRNHKCYRWKTKKKSLNKHFHAIRKQKFRAFKNQTKRIRNDLCPILESKKKRYSHKTTCSVWIRNSTSTQQYLLSKRKSPWLADEKDFSIFIAWNDLKLLYLYWNQHLSKTCLYLYPFKNIPIVYFNQTLACNLRFTSVL